MGEILLSRYDIYKNERAPVLSLSKGKSHITTNLNAEELEARYGSRVRSRLREMFNLIGFDESSKDKRI
jgi:hypothetical protein